jgi:hypothetical protein
VISDVLPRPLEDVPGSPPKFAGSKKNQEQSQTPVNKQVNVAPPPKQPNPTKR